LLSRQIRLPIHALHETLTVTLTAVEPKALLMATQRISAWRGNPCDGKRETSSGWDSNYWARDGGLSTDRVDLVGIAETGTYSDDMTDYVMPRTILRE